MVWTAWSRLHAFFPGFAVRPAWLEGESRGFSPKGIARDPLSLTNTNTSSIGIFRAIAAQYTCIVTLQQTAGVLHRPPMHAARQSPGAIRSRRQTCGTTTGRETAIDTALSLLREEVVAGDILKVH